MATTSPHWGADCSCAQCQPKGPSVWDLLSTEDLERMRDRAWTEACRDWALARLATDANVRHVLFMSAQSAEDYWQTLDAIARARS